MSSTVPLHNLVLVDPALPRHDLTQSNPGTVSILVTLPTSLVNLTVYSNHKQGWHNIKSGIGKRFPSNSVDD